MKKTIVFVITAMSRGGAERVISVLSNHYVNAGYNVSIVMLWHNHVEYELDSKIKIVDLSNDKIHPMMRLFSVTRKLRKYLKNTKPHAVVSFIAQNNLIAGIACRGINTRFIPSERLDPSAAKNNALFEKMLRRVYAKSTATVLQTERVKRYFPENVQKNSVIIANPISVKEYAASDYKLRILTAGRLNKQKNHEMLINAFKNIHDKHPEFSLTIYGEGVERENLENLICKLGLQESVELPGNVPDIHKKIKNAYMFVLSSDYEGLSNALLEAMMMGLPCISTNCAGSDEAIQDGESGIIVPVGDTQKLTEAMIKLIENENLRNRLAKSAMQAAEKYKVENVIQQWTDVIEGI